MERGLVLKNSFDVVKAIVFAILFSMVLVLILALIVKASGMSESVVVYINQAIKILSTLGGVMLGFRGGSKFGWLKGAIVGLLYVLISFFVFSLISGELSFSNVSWIDFVTGAAVGAISGIITVNVKRGSQASA